MPRRKGNWLGHQNAKMVAKLLAKLFPWTCLNNSHRRLQAKQFFLKIRYWNFHRLWEVGIKIVSRFIETATEGWVFICSWFFR